MKNFLLIFCGVLLAACSPETSTRSEILEKAVAKIDSNTPVYWLEMYNFLNEWEKTVLVFGYYGSGANRAACEDLRRFAEEGSPNRQFRCTRS